MSHIHTPYFFSVFTCWSCFDKTLLHIHTTTLHWEKLEYVQYYYMTQTFFYIGILHNLIDNIYAAKSVDFLMYDGFEIHNLELMYL